MAGVVVFVGTLSVECVGNGGVDEYAAANEPCTPFLPEGSKVMVLAFVPGPFSPSLSIADAKVMVGVSLPFSPSLRATVQISRRKIADRRTGGQSVVLQADRGRLGRRPCCA